MLLLKWRPFVLRQGWGWQAIEMMSLGTYVNGVILLIGLFFYDIFWVFGTATSWKYAGISDPRLWPPSGEATSDPATSPRAVVLSEGDNSVMVSVAKNFDAPIKLLFPKSYPVVPDVQGQVGNSPALTLTLTLTLTLIQPGPEYTLPNPKFPMSLSS